MSLFGNKNEECMECVHHCGIVFKKGEFPIGKAKLIDGHTFACKEKLGFRCTYKKKPEPKAYVERINKNTLTRSPLLRNQPHAAVLENEHKFVEVKIPQKAEDSFRRWWANDYMDLIVWFNRLDHSEVTGFQLCYSSGSDEYALTWRGDNRLIHTQIDTGECTPLKNKTPVLMPEDRPFDHETIQKQIEIGIEGSPSMTLRYIANKLDELAALREDL